MPLVQELRRANPDVQISVQVRTEGDVTAIADLIESLESSLDGVSILTSEETVEIAEALVAELRPPAPVLPMPEATQNAPELHAVVLPTANPNPSPRKSAPTPIRQQSAPLPADDGEERSALGVVLRGRVGVDGHCGGGAACIRLGLRPAERPPALGNRDRRSRRTGVWNEGAPLVRLGRRAMGLAV